MASEVRMKTQLHGKWHITDDTNILGWLSNVTDKMEQGSFEFGLTVLWAI